MGKYIFVIVSVFILCSCSDGLEKQAKKHLDDYIEEFAHNPDTYKARNMKTVYNNDSVCIIQFIGKGENLLGGYKSTHYEYIYVMIGDENENKYKAHEVLVNLDKKSDYNIPILKQCEEVVDKINSEFKEDIGEYKSQLLYLIAEGKALLHGRLIEDDE